MSARMPYDTYDNDDQGLFTNRSTMMANFEEWIKMATDNKINSRNSWNFALIDYFHDLNVLRDSENNINFQKASATLDGCVKIYSSRVDSVTTETGKLLSGLAQKKLSEKQRDAAQNNGEGEGGNGEGEFSEDDIQIDPATGLPIATNLDDIRTKRRVHNRVLETTLVDFDAIKMKELDQELSIDPLFKKALVDFDEGGAKSLLLNTLNIDRDVRVVFDTALRDTKEEDSYGTDDVESEGQAEDEDIDASISVVGMDSVTNGPGNCSNADITNNSVMMEDEILALGMDHIKFEDISKSVISPSMQQLPKVVEDITKAKTFIDGVNSKFDNFLSEKELEEAVPDLEPDEIDDDNIPLLDEFDDQQADDGAPYEDDNPNPDNDDVNGLDDRDTSDMAANDAGIAGVYEQDLMAYFDENLTKSWRGREHWKVRNLKKSMSKGGEENKTQEQDKKDKESTTTEEVAKKKKKASMEIDFFALDDKLEEAVFASKKKTNIELPQKSRTNVSHYLLPDDFHFTTQRITRLFIKPQQTMSIFQSKRRKRPGHQLAHEPNSNTTEHGQDEKTTTPLADEQFWAENYQRINEENEQHDMGEPVDIVTEGPENPFEDDEGGVDFNQAFEDEEINDNETNPFSTEGPTKFPPADNKVNFSRVSKKVDVKRLKDNIWDSIKTLANSYKSQMSGDDDDEGNLKFTEIAVELSKRYNTEAKKDISTSFCFICLLHLANEHGLKVTSTDEYEDLLVEFRFTSLLA